MENIYLLLFFCLFCWYFLYLRKVSEAAKRFADRHCEKEQLQFIAIARRKSRLAFNKIKGIYLLSIFDFEFSGDGESSYEGIIILNNLKVDNIELPAYRV